MLQSTMTMSNTDLSEGVSNITTTVMLLFGMNVTGGIQIQFSQQEQDPQAAFPFTNTSMKNLMKLIESGWHGTNWRENVKERHRLNTEEGIHLQRLIMKNKIESPTRLNSKRLKNIRRYQFRWKNQNREMRWCK